VLAAGLAFPCEFGFVPGTRGGDGDPLDVLVLFDDATFAGCVLPARLVGVLRAVQDDGDGGWERNDRLVAVACASHAHGGVRALDDVPGDLVAEIEHFLAAYNAARAKPFVLEGRGDADEARALVVASTTGTRTGRGAPRA
jgi:inorganic pyrophosphatase